MPLLVLKERELGQVRISRCTCFENFQIHLPKIAYRFAHTDHDTHQDFYFKVFRYLFLRLCIFSSKHSVFA